MCGCCVVDCNGLLNDVARSGWLGTGASDTTGVLPPVGGLEMTFKLALGLHPFQWF